MKKKDSKEKQQTNHAPVWTFATQKELPLMLASLASPGDHTSEISMSLKTLFLLNWSNLVRRSRQLAHEHTIHKSRGRHRPYVFINNRQRQIVKR